MRKGHAHSGTDRNSASTQFHRASSGAYKVSMDVSEILPNLSRAARLAGVKVAGQLPNRHRPHGAICSKCGTQSTKTVADGQCLNVDACAKRAWSV